MQIFKGEKLKRLTDKAGSLPGTRVSEYAAQTMDYCDRGVSHDVFSREKAWQAIRYGSRHFHGILL